MNYFYLLIISLTVIGCNQNEAENLEQPNSNQLGVHQDSIIGWTIEIPTDWKIKSKEEIAAINEKGIESVENAVGTKMNTHLFDNILCFSKDSMNMFQSIREVYTEELAAWKKNNASLKELFCSVYANHGARLDSSETTIEEVGGIKFESYEILFYDGAEEINMVQVFYSTLINGYDFSVSMCVTNEQNKRELMAIWENSIFAKREKLD